MPRFGFGCLSSEMELWGEMARIPSHHFWIPPWPEFADPITQCTQETNGSKLNVIGICIVLLQVHVTAVIAPISTKAFHDNVPAISEE